MTLTERKTLHIKAIAILSGIEIIADLFKGLDDDYVRTEKICRMEEYEEMMNKLNQQEDVQKVFY